MGGSAIQRTLQPNEKAVIKFEIYGQLGESDREAFNTAFKSLLQARGARVTESEVRTKQPGDP
jgi:hypothetical protein